MWSLLSHSNTKITQQPLHDIYQPSQSLDDFLQLFQETVRDDTGKETVLHTFYWVATSV
jgi:hypothetical protein